MYVCVCVCIYTHMYPHTHTLTNTHTRWFGLTMQKMFPVSGSGWTRALGLQLPSSNAASQRVAQFALGHASWSPPSVSPSVCSSSASSSVCLSLSAYPSVWIPVACFSLSLSTRVSISC